MLSCGYLVLFNPRTEEGSFPGIALLATLAVFAEHRRKPDGVPPILLGAVVVGLGTHFYGHWIYRPSQMWIKQAMTLLFLAYAGWVIATGRRVAAADREIADAVGDAGRIQTVQCSRRSTGMCR